ncbi:sensor histidine kinase [Chryseobacterium sp. DT-3]|uniref:sensor histidine kinase n=1 Tax=Chryseobacterium sp. DT-3 TaxID=3396164 RepID=UPI003F19CF2F
MGDKEYALGIATCAFFFFAVIIYSYSLYIHPKWYLKNRLLFFIALALLMSATSLSRAYIEFQFISKLFDGKSFFSMGRAHMSYVVVTNFVALILGVLLKRASVSLMMAKRQKKLEQQQLITEMKLLKAQLQPHFLFNSLNNIYYEAYKESPKAAQLIEMLAQIMRFFLEITSKEKIPVSHEILFIRRIIEMEQLRCYNAIKVEIKDNTDPKVLIAPMLMAPLVENALKHGIDKKKYDNYLFIETYTDVENIFFQIKNRAQILRTENNSSGTGLKNLKDRLVLIYGDKYQLQTSTNEDEYKATLIIPKI